MNVGLPGTGIGGLFYLLAVLVILVYEIYLTFRKRSSKKRWKTILEQTWIAASMTITIIVTNYFLGKYIFKKHDTPSPSSDAPASAHAFFLLQKHPILVPFILLAGVLIFTQILYILINIKRGYLKRKVEHP